MQLGVETIVGCWTVLVILWVCHHIVAVHLTITIDIRQQQVAGEFALWYAPISIHPSLVDKTGIVVHIGKIIGHTNPDGTRIKILIPRKQQRLVVRNIEVNQVAQIFHLVGPSDVQLGTPVEKATHIFLGSRKTTNHHRSVGALNHTLGESVVVVGLNGEFVLEETQVNTHVKYRCGFPSKTLVDNLGTCQTRHHLVINVVLGACKGI